MIERICPMCGVGVLKESEVTGLECSNCGEVFEISEEGLLEEVSYEKWKEHMKNKNH